MISSILLPIDLNNKSEQDKAAAYAVQMAQATGAKLHVITVIPDFGSSMVGAYFPSDYSEKAVAGTKADLDAFIAKIAPEGMNATGHVRHGPIYKEIILAADKLGVDMIVLGSHRPEMKDYLLGPNAARVVRHARQSVTVIR